MTRKIEPQASSAARPLRSYGRRKGKRLSPRKERLIAQLLPKLRPNLDAAAPRNLSTLFSVPVREVWLEIGFGSGEHLLWQAERNPDIGFVGCEPFINGVATLLGAIEDQGLKTVRVYDGDARDVLAWLPDGAIARAFVLFPDPWPKKRQLKRRLISEDLVRELARIMVPGAELRFASDDPDYADHTLGAITASDAFVPLTASDRRPDDWPETRYERKALREGRKPVYLSWRRL